ncbi:hypothetical protein DN069_32815, partial [Streptacidiphilus pinicola]
AADGSGVLLISSDPEELIEGSDRVVVLKEGSVVGELTGEQVTEDGLLAALSHHPDPPRATADAPEPTPSDDQEGTAP